MKKLLSMILASILCLSLASALADIDLSGMSYEELVALKDQINLAIWNSDEWQEVTVPQGVWKVGEDIPEGKWTIKCADVSRSSIGTMYCEIEWGNVLSDDGMRISWNSDRWDNKITIYNPQHKYYEEGKMTEYVWDAKNGDYIIIDSDDAPALFTSYSGKPDLGFKK